MSGVIHTGDVYLPEAARRRSVRRRESGVPHVDALSMVLREYERTLADHYPPEVKAARGKRGAIVLLIEALDDVPAEEGDDREAVKRLGIDVKQWAARIRQRCPPAE